MVRHILSRESRVSLYFTRIEPYANIRRQGCDHLIPKHPVRALCLCYVAAKPPSHLPPGPTARASHISVTYQERTFWQAPECRKTVHWQYLTIAATTTHGRTLQTMRATGYGRRSAGPGASVVQAACRAALESGYLPKGAKGYSRSSRTGLHVAGLCAFRIVVGIYPRRHTDLNVRSDTIDGLCGMSSQ
jgi:hypothetical protein